VSRPFLYTLGANVVVGACGLVTGALLARLLGPGGRGELAAVTLWPEVLVLVAGLGAPHTIAYLVSRRPEETRRVYANALALGVAQAAVVLALGALVVPLALAPRYHHTLGVALLYLAFAPMAIFGAIHAGLLQGRLRMARHSAHRLLPVATYLLGLVLAWALRGMLTVRGVVLILALSQVVSVAAGMLLARGLLAGGADLDRGLQGEMVRFGLKTQAAQATQGVNARVGALALSLTASAAALGWYAVAAGITGFFVTFGQAIGVVILPDVAGREESTRPLRVAVLMRRSLLLLAPLAGALALVAPWLVPALFGREFSPAVRVTQVLAAAALFVSLSAVLSDGFRGMSRPGVPAAAEAASLAVAALLLWLLIPRYGLMGAATATLAANAAGFALMALWLARCEGVGGHGILPRPDDVRGLRALVAPLLARRGA
jgi:O-antigen/teichoic acid export membrane protein